MKKIILAALIGFLTHALPAESKEVIIYTYEFPGETDMLPGGLIGGVAGEVITNALNKENISFKVIWVPWKRAQAKIIGGMESNAFIIPLSRNDERERDYQWVSKLYDSYTAFFSLGEKRKINSLNEIGSYRVGVLSGTSGEYFLRENGFQNKIDGSNEEYRNAKKLILGRIDTWYARVILGRHLLSKEGFSRQYINVGKSIETEQDYIATSKNSDKETVEKVKSAINKYKKTDEYKALLIKYQDESK